RDAIDFLRVTAKHRQLRAIRSVPEPNGLVFSARGEKASVGRIQDGMDVAFVPGQSSSLSVAKPIQHMPGEPTQVLLSLAWYMPGKDLMHLGKVVLLIGLKCPGDVAGKQVTTQLLLL